MRVKLAAQNPTHVAERVLVVAVGGACLGMKGTENVDLSVGEAKVECGSGV